MLPQLRSLPVGRFRFIAFVFLLFCLGSSGLAEEQLSVEIDHFRKLSFARYLEVDFSSNSAGTYVVESSTDMKEWSLNTRHLITFTSESGGTRSVSLWMPKSGRYFYRFKPKSDFAIRSELAENRDRWSALGIENYQYVTNEVCFCTYDYRRTVLVSVSNGEVDSVVDVRTGESIDSDRYQTIDGLFDRIEEGLDRPADFVTVNYDPLYGYPVSGDFDWSVGWADDENGFRARLVGFVAASQAENNWWVEDAFTIESSMISDDELKLRVSYSGGCSIHEFLLTMDPNGFMESNPVQLNLYLRHDDNGDSCDSIVEDEVNFDLSAIRNLYQEQYQSSGAILLNVHLVVDGVVKDEETLLWEP